LTGIGWALSEEAAMIRHSFLSALLTTGFIAWMTSSSFATFFYENFENGVSHSPDGGTWTKYPGATEYLQSSTNHNHTPGGSHSALAVEADPYVYNSYADFAATAGGVKATVYLFEDMNYVPPYLDQPTWKQPYIEVRNMFSLFGDSPNGPSDDTDYLQLRLIPDVDRPPNPPPDHFSYGIETKYNDDHGLGIIDTGVLRKKSQWMKLEIDADSMADGGKVRFYIDDALVGTSYRSGPDLRWVMLGATKITYENYWYDDVSVVDSHGDFNGDGVTDAADYVLWRNESGTMDQYDTWRAGFGTMAGAGGDSLGGATNAVPEPSSLFVMIVAVAALLFTSRGKLTL
jgi:hypothetical protein